MDCESTVEHFVPAADEVKITNDVIDIMNKMKWKTFDQFKKRAFDVWCIEMQNAFKKHYLLSNIFELGRRESEADQKTLQKSC